MKTVKFKFSVGTRYVGSTVYDELELQFDDDATDEEIEKESEECFQDWMWSNIDTNIERID